MWSGVFWMLFVVIFVVFWIVWLYGSGLLVLGSCFVNVGCCIVLWNWIIWCCLFCVVFLVCVFWYVGLGFCWVWLWVCWMYGVVCDWFLCWVVCDIFLFVWVCVGDSWFLYWCWVCWVFFWLVWLLVVCGCDVDCLDIDCWDCNLMLLWIVCCCWIGDWVGGIGLLCWWCLICEICWNRLVGNVLWCVVWVCWVDWFVFLVFWVCGVFCVWICGNVGVFCVVWVWLCRSCLLGSFCCDWYCFICRCCVEDLDDWWVFWKCLSGVFCIWFICWNSVVGDWWLCVVWDWIDSCVWLVCVCSIWWCLLGKLERMKVSGKFCLFLLWDGCVGWWLVGVILCLVV